MKPTENNLADKRYTDLSYLKNLSKGNDDFVKQMITIFINQTPEAIQQLEESLVNKDYKTLKAVAHKIKPSFSFVGINTLQTKIEKLEENANKETNLDLMSTLIYEIKVVALNAVKELQNEI